MIDNYKENLMTRNVYDPNVITKKKSEFEIIKDSLE